MLGWHVTTPAKLERYKATGGILPPVRFWIYKQSAEIFARRTGRTVIIPLEVTDNYYPLPDHKPRGHAYWTPNIVRLPQ